MKQTNKEKFKKVYRLIRIIEQVWDDDIYQEVNDITKAMYESKDKYVENAICAKEEYELSFNPDNWYIACLQLRTAEIRRNKDVLKIIYPKRNLP